MSPLYSQRIIQTAAVGKAPELRELNLAQVKARQAQGTRASLSTPVTGVGGRLVVGLNFDTLGDLQAFRERNASDAPFQQYVARISALMAKPVETELWELVLPAQPGAAAAYVQAVTWTAAVGKGPALRDAVVERFTTRQGEGLRCAVSEQVASDAFRMRMNVLFGSLSDLETQRAHNRGDKGFVDFGRHIASMLAATTVELSEVIVPFQPAAAR
jgi:hypothetical protein